MEDQQDGEEIITLSEVTNQRYGKVEREDLLLSILLYSQETIQSSTSEFGNIEKLKLIVTMNPKK